MAAADVQQPPPEPAPAVPDYLASPNAVFDDEGVQWRYGKPPDYSKTRKVWEEGKKMNHAAGSLPQLVENLVKNWEVEASFKPRLQDWRTIDHANYNFAINGGPPQSAEHMLKVGTYNAIIAPNEYYSPENSDFASSHKTFKRMMPTFAWEVIEVYSGPPKVSFKWRHWGVMKNDYVGFNDKGEKITAKAHGGPIEVYGVTVAVVDDKVRLQSVDTWFDPLDMFRQIAPHGVVNKEIMNRKVDPETALDINHDHHDGVKIAQEHNEPNDSHANEPAPEEIAPKHISESTGKPADTFVPHQGACPFAGQLHDDNASLPNGHPQVSAQGESVDGAQAVVETAANEGVNAKIERPEPNVSEQQKSTSAEPSSQETQHIDTDSHARSLYSSSVTGDVEKVIEAAKSSDFVDESVKTGTYDIVDRHLESSAEHVHPHPKEMEEIVKPEPGEAVAAPADSEETRKTHEEMSSIAPGETPLLMNRE